MQWSLPKDTAVVPLPRVLQPLCQFYRNLKAKVEQRSPSLPALAGVRRYSSCGGPLKQARVHRLRPPLVLHALGTGLESYTA
ncbi:hypothetical protein C2E21_8285 [Chlorella sorokiniana]|uniref:Uncharacterized protein n=1 Tax=Chlorella sorokiniana TaxID=3076 RepID=A0A2P6TET7_CHLSO|nr:hypothetical protein C2E21_8285 [Chlorella sorokiniana]|eukprot:PRW32481.1 hypothetical protein C2E21_8285 [Chlorella sorokiniana]